MFGLLIAGLKRLRTWACMFPNRKIVTYGKGLHVGKRTRIWAPDHVVIGRDVYIGKDVSIECNCRIGDYCLIANRVAFVGRDDHDFHAIGVPVRFSPWIGGDAERLPASHEIVVGDDVWIGYGAILLTGISIGRGSIIAAGSVVTRDVQSYSIVAGVPARVLGKRFDDAQIAEHEYRIEHGTFEFSERGCQHWIVRPYSGALPPSRGDDQVGAG